MPSSRDQSKKGIPSRERVSSWLLLGLAGALAGAGWLYWALATGRATLEPTRTRFVDLAEERGIGFVHNNGAPEGSQQPETMGSGVAYLDFDNSGSQDLLFVNSTYWPWEMEAGMEPATIALYRNDGSGRFADATAEAGLEASLHGMGAAAADYDNDGWTDVFVTAIGENRLFRNRGDGTYEEVTAEAGVAGAPNQWSASAAWVDVDRDGLLDLFVCNFARWPLELGLEMAFKLAGLGRAYAPPVNFLPTGPYLYMNNGDGTFEEVSEAAGLRVIDPETGLLAAKSLAVAPVDLEENGHIDLVVANHQMENYVFENRGDGTFAEVGARYRESGRTGGQAIGIDAARLSQKGWLDVAVGSFANRVGQLAAAPTRPLLFAGEAIGADDSTVGTFQRFGLFFFDYDLDGRLDLLAANGRLEQEINRIDPEKDYREPASLYWNTGLPGERRFMPVPRDLAGEDLFRPIVGRGAAFGDLDGDGRLDVTLTQNGGPPLVLFNRGSEPRNWLRVKLVGTRSNRDGIGSRVEVEVGSRTLNGVAMPTRSYLSQSELPVTIGLGRATKVRSLTVVWPDGTRQRVGRPPVNRTVVVRQE